MVKMTESNTRRRVKVYTLNDERQWDDRGTGHVSSTYVERLKGMTLIVRAEQDGTLLLESRILPDTAYQKQQETLIVWSEGENTDLALSFQEKAGCDEIWEKICNVQGKDPSVDITQDIADDGEEEDELAGSRLDDSSDSLQRQSTSPYVLPACELGELDEISELFAVSLPSVVRRDQLARAIEESDYINKLLLLFHTCEDLENKEGLHRLYEIMKGMFLLNRSGLFDILLLEKNIMDVVGCLEHDPALPSPRKHREYLLREVNFKEVLPIQNPELKKKIHQTFRLQYIQDVVLPTPSVFEENMLSTLSSLIFFNKVEIVNLVQEDPSLLSTIFKQLRDDATPDDKRCDLAGFVRELCSLSQTLQPTARDLFFRQLGDLGILQAIEMLLAGDHHASHRIAIDVFAHVVEHSPSMVRDFAHQEMSDPKEAGGEDDTFILNLVIEQMICDPDPELSCAMQLTGLLRVLLDPENMMANKNEKTEFLGFFYKNCMHVLMAPLLANTADEKKPGKDDYKTANVLSLILDLVTFSVEHHTYHVKNYVLNKDLLRRVLVLLNSRHSFLALSALRFMRKIVSTIDEFYNRYIIKGNLFQPIVNVLFLSGKRYNLLNSAILEMFEFIRVEDIKSLINHIVDKHYEQLQSVAYVKTFSGLKLRYDQQKSRENHKSALAEEAIVRNHRFRRDPRSLEEEEELWFEKDEEDPASLVFGDSFDSEATKINIDSILEKDKPSARRVETLKPISEVTDNKEVKEEDVVVANGVTSRNESKSPDLVVKNGLIGLVDYSDDESEEDDDNQSTMKPTEDKNSTAEKTMSTAENLQSDVENLKTSLTSNGGAENVRKDEKVELAADSNANNKASEAAAIVTPLASGELKIKTDVVLEEKKVFNNSDDEPARKKPRLLETIVDN